MSDAGRARHVVLHAAALFASLAALIGCQGSAPSVDGEAVEAQPMELPVGSPPQCAHYGTNPNAYGFCVYKFIGGVPSIAEVERICAMAGEWEAECRHAWVSGRMNSDSGFTTESLLGVCGENPDCTFELLDFRPETDPLDQISLCTKYAGRYARDCTGHALQRWWLTSPDNDELQRVANAPLQFPDRLGYYLAASIVCTETLDACIGEPRAMDNCIKSVNNFERHPDRCPSTQIRPLHPNISPDQLAPNQQRNTPNPPGTPRPMGTPPGTPAGQPPSTP